MTLIRCFQTCSLWGDSVSSLNKTLSLCVVELERQLALFRVHVVLKVDPLGALLKYRPDSISRGREHMDVHLFWKPGFQKQIKVPS